MNHPEKTIGDWIGQVAVYFIVLFVIAAVAAVLFPILARPACGGGRTSTCQSNLKECAIALQTYWNDYDGCLPSSAIVRRAKKWNKADFVTFATQKGALPPNSRPVTWSQALHNYMKSKDVMFCPSDAANHSSPSSQVTYWWKVAIDKAWYGVGCKKPYRREIDFAYNADQIVLYERAGFHQGEQNGLRNDMQINVAYLDTRVRCVSLVNSSKALVTDPAAPGEPRYFNFDNKRPRSPSSPPQKAIATYTDPNQYSDLLP